MATVAAVPYRTAATLTPLVTEDTVATHHPEYGFMAAIWEETLDVGFGGARAVKAKGVKYLPMLAWKEDAAAKYEAYKQRAICPNAVLRTRISVEGQVFRVEPRIVVDESLLTEKEVVEFLEHFAYDGASFCIYARRVFSQVFGMGRAICVTDTTPQGETRASLYGPIAMTNWWTEELNGQETGVRTVFCEDGYVPTGRWGRRPEKIRREYAWVEGPPPQGYAALPGINGFAAVVEHVYQETSDGPKWVMRAPFVPSVRGTTVSEFPITVINPYDLGYAFTEPPLAEMIDVNLSLYRTSADLEHGRHFAGVPAPYVFGVKRNTQIELGSSTFLTSENPNARAGFIEFTAQGLRALETAVTEKTTQLVESGARLFARQPGTGASVTTYEAGRLAATADWSIVESVARTTSAGLRQVMAQMIAFRQRKKVSDVLPLVSVMLNTDYEPLPMNATDALRWTEAEIQGGVSKETQYEIFSRGGVYPPAWSFEKEQASIKKSAADRAALLVTRGPQGNRPGRMPGRTPEGDRRVTGTRDKKGESQGSPTRSDGQP